MPSFHIMDPAFGHLAIKMSGHPPFGAQVMLNGHEYAAVAAQGEGIGFTKEGNCFTLGRLATPSGRPNAHVPEPAIDDDDYEAVLAAPMRTRPPHQPGHAFISYVREDSHEVDKLQRTLEDAGVSVWRDTSSLWPGENWRAKIHGAISRDALVFIACFSSHSTARRQTYQNEELLLAIEQLRLRQPDDPWLIPVRFNDCDVPDFELGAGRTLASIHRADLFGANREQAARRLTEAVQRLLR